MEKASLQEALDQKEAAERGLVVELESLSQQLQQLTRQLAELKAENAVLVRQKEAAAAEAWEREAGRKCRQLRGSWASLGLKREAGVLGVGCWSRQRPPVPLVLCVWVIADVASLFEINSQVCAKMRTT